MEIEGGSAVKVKVNADTFKVGTKANDDKKLVCELLEKKADIKSMVVSSRDPSKGPKPYSGKDCDLKLKGYTKKVDVQVSGKNKVTITTPLGGWKKVDGSKVNLWESNGDAPDVESIHVADEGDLKGYNKVNYKDKET